MRKSISEFCLLTYSLQLYTQVKVHQEEDNFRVVFPAWNILNYNAYDKYSCSSM